MTKIEYLIKYVNKGKVFSFDESKEYAAYHENEKQAMIEQFNHAKQMYPPLDFYRVCVITTAKVLGNDEQI